MHSRRTKTTSVQLTSSFQEPVPYLKPLPHQIHKNSALVVAGVVNGKNRFDITLVAGKNEADDISLHIGTSISNKTITFATQNGEQRQHEHKLSNGDSFEFKISVGDTDYLVFLNGELMATVEFAQPVESVEFLKITGDLFLSRIHWENVSTGTTRS